MGIGTRHVLREAFVVAVVGLALTSAVSCTQCLGLLTRTTCLQRCPREAPLRSGSAGWHGLLSCTPFDDDDDDDSHLVIITTMIVKEPRYRLVCNCFPDPGGGLPVRIWPGTIQVSRSR